MVSREALKRKDIISRIVFLFCVLVATIFRIVLKMGCPWYVLIQSAGADDWYQAKASLSILQGEWLGRYSWTTLSKGVSYPLFVAFSRSLNMPLGFSIGLFLSITVMIATIALFPLVNGDLGRCFVYIILLYSPIFFAPSSLQIYRNSLIPIASLGVISSAVAVYLRRKSLKSVFLWSLIESVYLPFFWYLREDSIWILPFCLAASVITMLSVFYEDKKIRVIVVLFITICLPYLTTEIYKISIKSINYNKYGVFVDDDRTETAYADVLELLFKIDDPDNTDSDIWLTKRSIEKAIEVSPTLATLQVPLMECRDAWAGGEDNELVCDLFGWILRLIADNSGLYRDAIETNSFYEKIREELTDAYYKGQLVEKQAIFLSSQTGGFQIKDFVDSFIISTKAIIGIINYNQCKLTIADINREIDGNNDQIMTAEYLLGITLNRSERQLEEIGVDSDYEVVNSMVENKRIVNATITNYIIDLYLAINWFYIFVLLGIVVLFYKEKERVFVFIRENLIWIMGIILTAYLDLYMVTLYNLWRTRDPMSNVAEYYAPSVYIFIEYIKFLILICVMTRLVKLLKERLRKNNIDKVK